MRRLSLPEKTTQSNPVGSYLSKVSIVPNPLLSRRQVHSTSEVRSSEHSLQPLSLPTSYCADLYITTWDTSCLVLELIEEICADFISVDNGVCVRRVHDVTCRHISCDCSNVKIDRVLKECLREGFIGGESLKWVVGSQVGFLCEGGRLGMSSLFCVVTV